MPIHAFPYINPSQPNLDVASGWCLVQFIESSTFMSILCAMMAFYIPGAVLCVSSE